MEFSREQIHEWHVEGVAVAKTYLRCEYRMVELLGYMHLSKGFYLYDCDGLREYAIAKWSLPDNAAADLVTVAKKACEIPEMVEALKDHRATVSKLRKVCPVITPEEQEDWLKLVEKSSAREIEKVVATENPREAMKTSMHYISESMLELRTGISEELSKNLKRLQDLLSQKEKRHVTISEALEVMADMTLEKLDPVRRAERAKKRKDKMQNKNVT